jgi:LysR family glycine cleavage system transcriptional activator
MCSIEFQKRHAIAAPEDLFAAPRLSPDDGWWKAWFAAAGLSEPARPAQRGVRLDSQAIEGNAAIAGQGAAMLSPLMWQPELAAGRLVQPFPLTVLEGPCYWLVYPEHKRGQAKIRAFREWLLAEVAAQAVFGPPEAYREPESGA